MEAMIEGQELILTPGPELAKPVELVSKNTAGMVAGLIQRAGLLGELKDQGDFERAAEILNMAGKLRTSIAKAGTDAGRPYRDESAKMKAEADKFVVPLSETERAVSGLMGEFTRKANEIRERALAEQRRLDQEAKARQEAAAKAVEAAKTDEDFGKAAEAFDDGTAAQELAQEAARLVVAPIKAAGVKERRVAVILSHDLAKLPVAYHELDEAKLKRHILDGTVTTDTPGVQFRIDKVFGGSGR